MYRFSKIETIFKRDKDFKITPVPREKQDTIFALARMTDIIVEEKIDGTNACLDICDVECYGWNINAYSRKNQICEWKDVEETVINKKDIMFIAGTLFNKVEIKLVKKWYQENKLTQGTVVKIYGEVFGDKIQKNIYTPKGIRDFRVFDIMIGSVYLSPKDRNEVCNQLELKVIPKVITLDKFPTYQECRKMLFETHNKSLVAQKNNRDEILEGYVLRPKISLYTNSGHRVMGKIKVKDFVGDIK